MFSEIIGEDGGGFSSAPKNFRWDGKRVATQIKRLEIGQLRHLRRQCAELVVRKVKCLQAG